MWEKGHNPSLREVRLGIQGRNHRGRLPPGSLSSFVPNLWVNLICAELTGGASWDNCNGLVEAWLILEKDASTEVERNRRGADGTGLVELTI